MFQKVGEVVEHIADEEEQGEGERKDGEGNQEFPEDITVEDREPQKGSPFADCFQVFAFVVCNSSIFLFRDRQ